MRFSCVRRAAAMPTPPRLSRCLHRWYSCGGTWRQAGWSSRPGIPAAFAGTFHNSICRGGIAVRCDPSSAEGAMDGNRAQRRRSILPRHSSIKTGTIQRVPSSVRIPSLMIPAQFRCAQIEMAMAMPRDSPPLRLRQSSCLPRMGHARGLSLHGGRKDCHLGKDDVVRAKLLGV